LSEVLLQFPLHGIESVVQGGSRIGLPLPLRRIVAHHQGGTRQREVNQNAKVAPFAVVAVRLFNDDVRADDAITEPFKLGEFRLNVTVQCL
jgi:hypothetical protein